MLIVMPRCLSSGALSIASKARERVVLGVVSSEHLRDGRGQSRLAVVNVPHRPDVEVGLRALEFLFGH